jgi:hypothetical protein
MDINDIANINDRTQLEAIGALLTAPQARHVISHYAQLGEDPHSKLNALLVGIKPDTFFEVIASSNNKELEVLKQESVSEPIHFHLLLFHNKMLELINELDQFILGMSEEILKLDTNEMGMEDITPIKQKIEELLKPYQSAISIIDKALSIAWNTDRADLIEKLSSLKERCQRSINVAIGNPGINSHKAIGLYGELEDKLFAVYGKNIMEETLLDTDPAIEALAKLSIWYLQDYYSIGLLPKIASAEDLELDPASHSEHEILEQRRKLFIEANKELERLGLVTVKDLKNAGIFSKKSLEDYLQKKEVNR